MNRSKPRADAPDKLEIKIKRESWKNGLHSVARDNLGRWVTTRKWHSKKDTEIVKDIIVLRVSFPKEYVKREKAVKTVFKRTGIKPEKYVYLLQAKTDESSKRKYDANYLSFSMTSSVLLEMNESNKISLFAATRHAYGDSPIKFRIIRIYDSRDNSIVKKYVGQKFEI